MKTICLFIGLSLTVICFSLTNPAIKDGIGIANTLAVFSEGADEFSIQILNLKDAIAKIKDNDSNSVKVAKKALIKSRLAYKKIEFFLHYFLPTTSIIYNAPPNYEVEVPFMEAREPMGLQVIEGYLFETNPYSFKKELEEHVYLISASASDLNSLLFNLEITDKQILESIRLGIYNVMNLGIVGFDAPELKTGIAESEEALKSFELILEPYVSESKIDLQFLKKSISFLNKNPDFDSFDRLGFLIDCAIPLQTQLNKLVLALNLYLNTTPINYNVSNIFAKDGLLINEHLNDSKLVVDLGKRLFFENALSGNLTRNCGSCHNPKLYFTDGLPKSLSIDGKTNVQRNSPTLMYSALQHSQFLDGRAASLSAQIKEVLKNPNEMNADLDIVVTRLKNNSSYVNEFKKAFPTNLIAKENISIDHLSHAISAYIKTLSPFNSSFDQYIQGNKKALNESEKRGFNLFMGKAQCGSCHFAPIFNGLTPPFYDRNDLEILGTTLNADFKKPILDSDNGRYNTYPYIYFKGAFKTPSIRNAAVTAPYMHNGNFATLESVIDFYDNGGGAGLGLDVPLQTLSAKKLNLSDSEKKDIIKFIHALSDKKPK